MSNLSDRSGRMKQAAVALLALGVVYGDIGTSPLYAVRACFEGPHGIELHDPNILGVLSLIVWSLTLIVSIKYLGLVVRVDNRGEGGILALMSLACPESLRTRVKSGLGFLPLLGIAGAALLYGDGMITPAISVLSAVEGLGVATSIFEPFIIPITIAVLIGLFSFQHLGSGRMGRVFGPVMVVWFLSIGVLGLVSAIQSPRVLLAVNPLYAVEFFIVHGFRGFLVVGAVFLAVTGAEGIYTDLGHFGRSPIRRAWFSVVLPSLLLNYFGQGALLLRDPLAIENPFYMLAPGWALYPLVALATAATVIASQALISGAFSLTVQAIQLGYWPRQRIDYTSSEERGQIYLPGINWTLMLACIGLVLGFRTSSHLASAYGIAVALTMTLTTIMFFHAVRRLWRWSFWTASAVCLPFLVAEVGFSSANLLKAPHGGWFPLVVAVVLFTLMTTWKTGRQILRRKVQSGLLPIQLFLDDLRQSQPTRVKGTAVFLASSPDGTPLALLHNLKHNKVLHERIVILTIIPTEVPHVSEEDRVSVKRLAPEFYRVTGQYGFMERISVPRLLNRCAREGLAFDLQDTTFFLSRETIVPTRAPGMALWREKLFSVMSRNAQSATAFFNLPANRVVELGMLIEF